MDRIGALWASIRYDHGLVESWRAYRLPFSAGHGNDRQFRVSRIGSPAILAPVVGRRWRRSAGFAMTPQRLSLPAIETGNRATKRARRDD